jgi:PleD family two-component response regulator
VAVLLIAIDQIPEIVRRHGGDAGQAVLDALGARLRERATADELYGRSDAQHIAVLLPSTSDVDARIAEITAAVAGAEFHIRAPGSSNPVHVDTLTPSFGVARLHEDGNDTEDLLAAAVLDLNSTAARSQSVTSGTAPHLPASLHAFWAQRLGRDETP